MIARREQLAYAAGDAGFNFVWQSIELYLLYFYVYSLGLAPQVAAGIFLAGAVVDWFADPLIGALADRLAPRVPLRAWLLVGGPATGAALVLAFAHPALDPEPLALWALGTHVALRAAYSLGNIPYAALTARISADPRDQIRLTARRMQGAAAGGLIAAAVFAAMPAEHGGDFVTGALLLGALAQPMLLATFLGVRERVVPGTRAPLSFTENIGELWVLIARSGVLRQVLIAIVAAGLAITVVHKSILFLFHELAAARLGYVVAAFPSIALLLTAAAWGRLGERLGRRRTLRIAAAINALALAGAAAAGGGLVPATIALAIAVIAGCGMSVMLWAMVPAAIGIIEAGSGGGCAARAYALGTTARKLGQALAPQVIALSLVGGTSVLPGLALTGVGALGVILLVMRRSSAAGALERGEPDGEAA